jgi:hypothetical protein
VIRLFECNDIGTGEMDFFLDFVIDLVDVYDTFVAVMLLCVCRLSLYLTIISLLCPYA